MTVSQDAGDTEHLVQPWPVACTIGQERRELIGEARGIYVRDESGRWLIDGPAGMWCTNVGHRNEELARTLYEQAMELSYNSPWYTSNAPSAALAARIAEHAPGDLAHVFFTTGGSTAVESAIRFVQFYNNVLGRPQKKMLLCREGGYHGSTYLSASLNGSQRSRNWMDFEERNILRLSSPNPYRRPEGMSITDFTDHLIAELASTIATHGAERIAAFVAEPVMASGGVIVPPEGYLPRAAELCRKHGILFVSDEVVTGFGRLGHIFASGDVFGVEPDILVFAKGLTSGYFPMGGMIVSKRLMEDIRDSEHPDAMYAHGLTYYSHPIGAAVAMRNMDLLEDGILEHAREVIPYFQQRLRTLDELALVGEVRGVGMMACVESVADRSSRNPLALDIKVGSRIDRYCQSLGLLVRPLVNMCVMSPPLVIEAPQIDRMTDILYQGIARTMDDLRKEGIWDG